MLDAITRYWYFSLVFVVVTILTVFVWYKAAKASARTRREREKTVEKLKYENTVRAFFKELTAEKAEAAPAKELVDGAALNIQLKLEKAADINSAFERLPAAQKHIYAIYYVLTDGAEKLSEFFRMNGKPLTPAALEAAETVWGGKAAELFEKEYAAFDEDNEDVSLVNSEIEALDKSFSEDIGQNDLYAAAADYIKKYLDDFAAVPNS